jgi:hypothetical protein
VTSARVVHSDCLAELRAMAARGEVVQVIVTDPPYELGFMSKNWDRTGIAFRVETWRAAYDVLPPGGYLLAFGGTRTYHRMVCAIEDAGFRINDCIMWLHGQGFPKNRLTQLKPAVEPIVVAQKPLAGMTVSACVQAHGTGALNIAACRITADGSRPAAATYRGAARSSPADSTAGTSASRGVCQACRIEGRGNPASPDAQPVPQSGLPANGFGCAAEGQQPPGSRADCPTCPRCGGGLAPVAATGGQASAPLQAGAGIAPGHHGEREGIREGLSTSAQDTTQDIQRLGRWPANLCHDNSAEVLEAFATFGERKTGAVRPYARANRSGWAGPMPAASTHAQEGDTGTAARFFYSAKASRLDRAGSSHPTTKPTSLMSWLVKLVTPPGGTVLDMFAGSGTTGVAAMREGFDCILIEREAEYVEMIRARLALETERMQAQPGPDPQLALAIA